MKTGVKLLQKYDLCADAIFMVNFLLSIEFPLSWSLRGIIAA